jgi:hypothetical protein
MIKKGDVVRFLNEVGGGTVVRVDEAKKLLYVEDADGFEIPVPERECIMVGEVNMETNIVKKDFSSKALSSDATKSSPSTVVQPQVEAKEEPIVETSEGDVLKALLAFFPVDIKQLQTTSYDCYLINDSNYFLYYNIVVGENNQLSSVANGLIDPNMQEELCTLSKDDLNAWENVRIQLLAFKKGKIYDVQNVIDLNLKLNVVRFYKLHSFVENDYFDEPAMIVDIVIAKEKQQLADVSPEEIKKAMFSKEDVHKRKRIERTLKTSDVIEIDLHINELIDSTAGMSNADMLNLQMDKFHQIIADNVKNKGQKIVFIHGKGEGVLRKEIEKQLKSRYKSYYFQDASFREYGFGATMVTIK